MASVLVMLWCSGCATIRKDSFVPQERRLSVLRAVAPPFEEIKLSISRHDFLVRLEDAHQTSRARLVEIFASAGGGRLPWPEYRLFDVGNESVYSLLGLRNADTIVAVDDMILANPDVFKRVIPLLSRSDAATIEIRRGETAKLLQYHFVD